MGRPSRLPAGTSSGCTSTARHSAGAFGSEGSPLLTGLGMFTKRSILMGFVYYVWKANEMIGERLHGIRLAHGLSLRALASQVGVSAMMVSKYERNLSQPSTPVLASLANTFRVRPEYFTRPTTIKLDRIESRNRHRWKLPVKIENRILADVRDQLERRSMLDLIAPMPWPTEFELPCGLPSEITDLNEIEGIAIRIRRQLQLGLSPIPNLIDALETIGIKVLTAQDDDQRFEGISARAGDLSVIVVGTSWPGDRQRFTVAHELGHLVLDGRLAEGVDKETACDRFAGAFLVPEPKAKELMGVHRTSLEVCELHFLKHKFGLSIAGWSHRALDLGIVRHAEYRRFRRMLAAEGWDQTEPGTSYPSEHPSLFEHMVHRTFSESLISESKAAELLGIQQLEFAQKRCVGGFDAIPYRRLQHIY